MPKMRCNNIKPEYNRLLFTIKPTPGDRVCLRTSHGITTRPIPEGYYMKNRKAPKKINPVKSFVIRMIETMKGIFEAMKTDKPEFADTKDILGSTIEM